MAKRAHIQKSLIKKIFDNSSNCFKVEQMQNSCNDYINAQMTRDTIGSYWSENLKFSNCPIEQNVCRNVHDRRFIRSGEMWQG